MSNLQKLTIDQKELALQVNSLVMAVHLWDDKAIDEVMVGAGDDCGHVMFGAILWLKRTLDDVFDAINADEDVELQFTFEDLLRESASSILENNPESC